MNGLKAPLLGAILLILTAGSLASSSLEGQPAPDFVLKSASGENLRLSEYRGDVVMINFWATWCGPCRQEMPLLDDLYGRRRQTRCLQTLANTCGDRFIGIERFRTIARVPKEFNPSSHPLSSAAAAGV